MKQYDNKTKRALAVYVFIFFLMVMGILISGYVSYGNFEGEFRRQVDFNIQEELTAEGDSNLLEAVLANLLDNAFKFTGKCAHAHIEFGQTELQGQRVFFVRDNGAGFDMAYSQKFFGAFQRMHKVSEFPGAGIGLATVQRVIHRHGGRVWAEAEVESGAMFCFTLEPSFLTFPLSEEG